jgi:hypothetical protein
LPSRRNTGTSGAKRAGNTGTNDVARARRRWIRQQGYLDTTRLVFIDETAITTNMVRVRSNSLWMGKFFLKMKLRQYSICAIE